MFTVVGCDTYAFIKGSWGRKYAMGCLSLCDRIDDVINGSCSGIGCCQTRIPKGVTSYKIGVSSYNSHTFAVGTQTCAEARKNLTTFACKDNSDCEDFDNGPEYRCKCSKGYEGNPYIPNGCQDIDERAVSSPCNMTCLNLLGTYTCSCAVGYEGDGKKNGSGCSQITVPNKLPLIIYISLGISIGISVLLIGGSWLHWGSKQRKVTNLREKLFQENGVNHRNVVKLLGCCLETKVPFLVYEFITNGTLDDHIHTACQRASSITWDNRLRIAVETATAFSYLHSAASTPIIHRDVKTANILLDDNYVAKVSDFRPSRLITIDETQLRTLVQGTRGYLDPEYLQTGQLTQKSDVYSFGVVLVELLTSKKVISFSRPEAERNLAMYFILAMKEDRLFEIVDEQMMDEARVDKLKKVAILAKRCLEVKGDERPSMKEVAMELEGLRMTDKHPWVNDIKDSEETQHLLGDQLLDAYGGKTSMSNSAIYDSMINNDISSFNGGR
ncbi:hypothetical protein ACSBR1_001274 [Camellia fascicularis]